MCPPPPLAECDVESTLPAVSFAPYHSESPPSMHCTDFRAVPVQGKQLIRENEGIIRRHIRHNLTCCDEG